MTDEQPTFIKTCRHCGQFMNWCMGWGDSTPTCGQCGYPADYEPPSFAAEADATNLKENHDGR